MCAGGRRWAIFAGVCFRSLWRPKIEFACVFRGEKINCVSGAGTEEVTGDDGEERRIRSLGLINEVICDERYFGLCWSRNWNRAFTELDFIGLEMLRSLMSAAWRKYEYIPHVSRCSSWIEIMTALHQTMLCSNYSISRIIPSAAPQHPKSTHGQRNTSTSSCLCRRLFRVLSHAQPNLRLRGAYLRPYPQKTHPHPLHHSSNLP